jgi:hypothetical protein
MAVIPAWPDAEGSRRLKVHRLASRRPDGNAAGPRRLPAAGRDEIDADRAKNKKILSMKANVR